MTKTRALIPLVLLASACGNLSNTTPKNADGGMDIRCCVSLEDRDALDDDGGPSEPPQATDTVTIRGNLDQAAPLLHWNPASPATTSNLSTKVNVFDSAGKAIRLDIYFVRDEAAKIQGDSGAWIYHVTADGANLQFQSDGVTLPTPGKPAQIAAGILRFGTAGRFASHVPISQGFYPAKAQAPQTLTFNFGTGTADGGSGLDGITQHSAPSTLTIRQSSSSCVP